MTIPRDARATVIHRLQQGDSMRAAAKAAGVSPDTASRIAKELGIDGSNSKNGRPSLLTEADRRLVARKITSGQVDTAVDATKMLKQDLGISVSAQTVRNALKDVGMVAKHKVKKPAISSKNRLKRLAFARTHKDWTVEDWRRVIWSDESKINRLGSDGRAWCWKRPGEGLNPRTVTPTVKHGGGSLMVWGCMTAEGVGYLCKIDNGLDAELYCNILRDDLVSTIDYYHLDRRHVIFQQDNDPKHTSKVARQCIRDLGLDLLDWPAQSPDLNPIEHLWDNLKRKLNGYPDQATSMHMLWDRVQEQWDKITKQECLDLIESMPRRIKAVLDARGFATKY